MTVAAAHCTVFTILILTIGNYIPTSFSSPTTLSQGNCAGYNFTCSFNRYVCQCDEQLCKQFGDCCAELQYTQSTTGPEFTCVSTSVLNEGRDVSKVAYFMIASCPESQSDSEIMKGLAELCEAQSLSSPPISDNRTGLVYRNKYCAQCHGVPEKEQISWRSEWRCNLALRKAFEERNATIDIGLLLDSCRLSRYTQPLSANSLSLLPRTCDPRVVYTCQPLPGTDTSTAEYRALRHQCRSQLVNISTTVQETLYKNEFCALCSTFRQRLRIFCPEDPAKDMPVSTRAPTMAPTTRVTYPPPTRPRPITFALFLDVTGSGKIVIASEDIVVTSTVEQSCGEGQAFDLYSNVCREALCQPGYTYNGTACLLLSTECALIALNATEYQTVSNATIFWKAQEQNVSVRGYSTEGNPLVCTNFTSNFNTTVNETIARTLYNYPPAFVILSYLGLSIDVVAAAILLFTYAVFAEMRTFYGKLFMNFVLVLLLGDLTFLLGDAVYAVSLNDVVCQVVAILLHYLFLARFVWMSLLSLNVARHFYHAMKMVVNEERESWHYLMLYMAAGWLSPLLVLFVTVPVNYAIPGAVGYGVDGLCWMNHGVTVIVSFIVPLSLCILFTTAVFVFVCTILLKLHRSEESGVLKHKTNSRNCRVLVAIFFITGAMWVFGFLALIDSALSWAWYLFIILNTTQAVFLTLAYVCTAKVLRLYCTALSGTFQKYRRKHLTTVLSMFSSKRVPTGS